MTVSVAEYLGQKSENADEIVPIQKRNIDLNKIRCPFRNGNCDKAAKGNHPVCAVRDIASGAIWISCEHRLCSTSPKNSPLSPHQIQILSQVSNLCFRNAQENDDVMVKREVPIRVTDTSNYKADFVMWTRNPYNQHPTKSDKPILLEMQGGGETTGTGNLSRHISEWAAMEHSSNEFLRQEIRGVGVLATNAWRRQQEQFLVKGNVSMMSGGRMVFCVGTLLFDYLMQRFIANEPRNLRNTNWTLAIIGFQEVSAKQEARLEFKADESRMIFTNYNSFVQTLTNQATPSDSLFTGEYMNMLGETFNIPT